MKFYCDKTELLNAAAIAARAVASKSTLPSLEGLLLETGNGVLFITGYDLKTGIKTSVEAEITTAGSIVLNAKLFTDILRNMPSDRLTVESEQTVVKISCFASEYEVMGTSTEDYPDLPSVDEQTQLNVKQGTLKSMISQTLFAVSSNESKPIHTGSLFEVERIAETNEVKLILVSVDGYRLALRREKLVGAIAENQEDFKFVVPGAMLNEIEKICGANEEENVQITIGTRFLQFTMGQTQIISRKLEGDFLDYRRSVPDSMPIEVEADRKALQTSIDRVSLLITDTLKSPLRITVGDGVLKAKALTQIGKAQDECLIKGNGGDLEIGFNNKYIQEALKAAPVDELKLRFNSAVNPLIIVPATPDEDGDFLYMTLPVRLSQ
jgi:DNA polymerase-3 subunit beta